MNKNAEILANALPWLKKYHGEVIVVKYGGNAMTDDTLKRAFAEDVAFLRFAGFKPVVVHGGGPQISSMLERLGIKSEFRGGLRVTTPEAMDVVRMVLVGQVQRELVGLINEHGPLAVGLSGEDAGLFTAKQTNTIVDGEEVDLGLVGEVAKVRPEAVLDLVAAGRIPVISSVAPDEAGLVHNVNADTAAAALAIELGAAKLLVLTDVEGLYRDWPGSDDVIGEISPESLAALMPSLASGMVPKMAACLQAVANGVPRATVVDGREPHAVLAGDRRRRPRAARGAGRDLHRRGRRHPSPAWRGDPDPEGGHPMSTWQERYAGAVMNTFGPPKLALVRGAGTHVWDSDGNEYVDLLGGIAVNALGHAHPALIEAVTNQLSTLGHISNFFASEPQIALAEKLLGLIGDPSGRVFFTNSGTEANEAAFKATRRTGRTHVVAMEGSFHGRTMGALALTSKPAYREPFAPLPGEVTFVPFGDVDALAAAVTDQTAAVLIEPIQGEAGVIVAPDGFLRAAREITTQHGALLWLDEVQTGMGRTGAWFAHTAASVTPDLVTLAKGLGGGVPIGACLALGAAATLLQPGNHGTTFGGNPVAAAAALAVISTIEDEQLLEHVTVLGHKLRDGLAADPRVSEVRGEGLLIGIELAGPPSAEVADAALAAGFIVNNPTPTAIRLAPPLVLSQEDAVAFIEAWPSILDVAEEDLP
ncbi:bifunctional enzyme (acetylornithine transaminase and Acetylglutamate kinase) [metagenome]|uniref:acetylglutamate kinase n=1 Tax=metagenome TaxID=256318 RepID=A0A2P2BWN3_9ZZZZ